MKNSTWTIAAVLAMAGLALAGADARGEDRPEKPLVQIALLLDTSNSMDGLIAQAKTQLWKVVNEVIAAKREGSRPEIQVALYEYGKQSLPGSEGYIRMVLPLTADLDKVSEELFALTTNGGDEYCGHVIQRATQELQWSKKANDLKVIFIAGNEPFTQGTVNFRGACKAAVSKGIVVNTIHCGSEQEGIGGKWKDGALLADGRFLNIDQNRQIQHIAAPQDGEIARLGAELNQTYVSYGPKGKAARKRQAAQDGNATSMAPSVAAERAVTKSSAGYKNAEWDLVDAQAQGAVSLEAVKDEDLPDEMKGMDAKQRRGYVEKQSAKRGEIQKRIQQLNDERRKFITTEQAKQAKDGKSTLDEAMLESIRGQAKTKGFSFE